MTVCYRKTMIAALLAGGAMLPTAAFAQDAPAAAAAPDQAATDANADIVVTARFRSESVQDVPIAITAIGGQSLAERQLNNLERIATAVPAVEFRTGASNKDRTVFIRGVGTITTSPGVEPSVSTVLDGVVLSRPGQSTLDLGEVDHIEVLRGPQGTLFGKNASAGVINIVTRNPTEEFHAFGEAGATTDEEYRIKAGISGGLAPGLSALIGGLYTKWDGNVVNRVNGHNVNGFRRYGARGKVLYEASPDLKFTLIGDYLNSRDTTPTSIYKSISQTAYPTNVVTTNATLGTILAGLGVTPSASNRSAATNFDSDVRDKNYGASLTAELGLGDYHITSITAYRGWKNHQHQDFDGIATLAVGFPQGEDFGDVNSKQFSQELRLTSPKNGGFIDYVLGAYYLHAKTDERYQRTITTLPGPITTRGVANYGVTDDNYAVFGEANLNFTDSFRGIAGYRSVWDDIDFYHVRTSDFDPGNVGEIDPTLIRPGIRPYHKASGSTNKRGDSYRLGLQLDLGDHAQTYFTYSRGYKGPGYNVYFNMRSQRVPATGNVINGVTVTPTVQPLDEVPLSPETSKSFEFGLKGSAVDRSVSYSLAVYHTDFDGFQANFADTVGGLQVTRLINAGSVRTQGIEADVTLRPTRGLTFDISTAFTDAKVKTFNCPVGAAVSCNVNGQPLPFAPKFKLYGNGAYKFAITSGLNLELQSDVTFRSKTQYSLSETPNTIEPSYAIWNASIALMSAADGWQVRAYVKNIANTSYSSFLGNGSAAGTVRFVPRDDKRFGGILLRKDF